MKIKISHFSIIFFGVLCLTILANVNFAQAQCNLDIESKVVSSEASMNAEIQLKLNRGEGAIDFYLIDLKQPQKGPVQKETKSASELRNEFVVVFRNVPPSKYTVQAIDSRKCQVSIGGVEGIIIPSN